MYNFLLLLKLRLKERTSPVRTITLVIVYCLLFAAMYFGGAFLASIQMADTLPLLGFVLSITITFVITVLSINESFSKSTDSEFLLSVPLSSAVQVFVSFFMLYVKNLLLCILFQAPLLIVSLKNAVSISIIRWFVGLLLTSLPINGIAMLVGVVLSLCLSLSSRKNQIMNGITVFLITAVIAFLMWIGDVVFLVSTGRMVVEGGNIASGIIEQITLNFKFGRFYQNGIINGDAGFLLLFCFMSFIWCALFLFIHTMSYQIVVTSLNEPTEHKSYSAEELSTNSLPIRKALFKKEIKQFVLSKRYFSNTFVGLILMLAVPINLMIVGADVFDKLKDIAPLLVCAFIGMSCTTYCSISMEGKRYWILESTDISKADIARTKVFMNLVFTVPFALLSVILFESAFKMSFLRLVIFVLTVIAYAIFSAIYGIAVDYKFSSFEEKSEEIILRQGKSFFIGYLPLVIAPISVAVLSII